MAINSTNRRSDYIGDGIADVFNYMFKIFEAEDLLVIMIDDEGEATELVLDVHYSVQNVGYNTGSITLLGGPLEEDFELIILGDREAIQNSNIRNRGSFYPNDHETFFDHVIMLIQQILERLSRVITLPYWIKSNEFDPTLPDNNAQFLHQHGPFSAFLHPRPQFVCRPCFAQTPRKRSGRVLALNGPC